MPALASPPDALALLVEQLFPAEPDARRDALVRETLRALAEPDAGAAVHALLDRAAGAALVVALSPDATRGSLVALSPAGACAAPGALDALLERALATWPRARLRVGGPPGGYLLSGLDARDHATEAALAARGFRPVARHVDLHATLATTAPPDPRVRRARRDEGATLGAWISATFAPAWAREVRRALQHHDAVFVAGDAPDYRGFAAHSGVRAALGTFGPLGVAPGARGAGLGAALARAALDDLHARGFSHATIPWVDPAVAPFYARLVERHAVLDRVVLATAASGAGTGSA